MILQGYSPRESQRPIFKSPARFLSVDAGRRWGKTVSGLNWGLEGICNEGGPVWWIAPIYATSKMAYRRLIDAAWKGGAAAAIKDKSETELRVEFINGEVLWFKTGDNPDNLRGEGIKRAILDEGARLKRDVWEGVIRPALSDTNGRALIISTPKGKNWFYEIFERGQDPLQAENYQSWKFPTADNPRVPSEDIEQAKQTLPLDVFKQEYLAEFLENQAGVFRNIEACVGSAKEEPVAGKQYFAGLDHARTTDFTVLTILDNTGRQIYFDRFNILSWAIQRERIIPVCKKYKTRLFMDSTAEGGDMFYEDLRLAKLNVEGYKFTAESKKMLIESLMIGFDRKEIKILDDGVQKTELNIFEYKLGPSGIVHYSAPEGYHDDCVCALALAWWSLKHVPQMPNIRSLV
jgi:hypothetical protein